MWLCRLALGASLALLAAGCVSGDIGGGESLPGDAARAPFDAVAPDDDAGQAPPRDAAVSDAAAKDAAMPPMDAGPPKPPVTFDPPGRGFSGPLTLKLTAGDADAVLHYTIDGSLPSASSPAVSGPITISTTTLVRVISVKAGAMSPVFNQSYFELDPSVQSFSSNLPVLIAHMQGGSAPQPSNRSYVPGMVGVFTPGSARTQLAGSAQHTSRMGIKIRGRSSRSSDKPSYSLELWGAADEDAPASMLGLPADGDWVLYAPYDWDKSMLHNAFAYDLSRRIGRYAPRTQFCELFLVTGATTKVTMANYVGIYVFTERLTRSKDRVAIDKLQVDEVVDPARSGGYIVKVDEPDMQSEAFSAAGLTFVYVDPDVDEIVSAQKQYIADYLNASKRAVSAGDGKDPMSGKHYSELMDVPSFIDHHILSVLLKNPDAFALSSYFYKDRDGKLFAGPLWDFDLAMGANDPWGQRSVDPTYWGPNTTAMMFRRSFWGPLFNHSEFATAYWARWDELLASTFTSAKFRGVIDAWEMQLTEAEQRNRTRWPKGAPRNNSYPDEIDALETWLDARLGWIKANKGVVPQ
ncbi:MAG TPA: CotH kinase family protein [Polyangiales bacterium]|nr:CotH kinase family protein [Polyangiales bacterium]